MENGQGSAPPPYPGEGPSQSCQWKVRNAKYRSNFTNTGEPSRANFREQLECLKDSLNGCTRGVGCPTDNLHIIEVQHSQAFAPVEHFIDEYQAFLRQIKPLNEEDILFLLLSRYATTSGASVYTEIRHKNDVHVFDTDVSEPLHTDSVVEHLMNGSGVIHSEMSLQDPQNAPASLKMPLPAVPLHDHHASTTQTSHGVEFAGSINLNFPAILANDRPHEDIMSLSLTPPVYDSLPHANASGLDRAIDWGQIPEKFQPPMFHVHRCHHRGMERVDEDIELPFGFPELVQHFHNTPTNIWELSHPYHEDCSEYPGS
ncbi:hypothetical protein COCC4DRAFT_75720 [Bipolaris maydis ATCC 48331]|uniref:Uncharacterized protein n=1 Tax=Cochliobolus heterostrophus (strain C4 / ATCC 48331 / race T) TaxID=665024 RepID=N4WM65_COCH4|nr:uncharacterized protein COCC4DRAFT_75720 [Bipolaris maydis ATCC 48331]KAJ5021919.1 hypothetical protein J3E73DRAFT_385635 [Bipolaris maydis]ENI00455.1 hypothetical protein COCC4DRAFT_75720 [Bipolaris maydis ATCC 48331]KAJ5035247.1 hypothetical protein J3E74DRAFT_296883 [Bipolaris maydis]KAJ5055091.1 hypothetical protein J3E74DRAFT_295163 [Bipolaris maydis]KAJ6275501.1 hypothetical protein PSV08DRAFT_242359 [Bipolaris maydis]